MTDVQIFSKGLTREEMISYTTCQKVSFYLAFIRIANEYAQDLQGNLANWEENGIWRPTGSVTKTTMDKTTICSTEGSIEGMRKLLPSNVNWFQAVDMCRQLDGRLHIDTTPESVLTSYSIVEKGERINPDRCARVWLGASDIQEEGVWRDSETNEVLDLRAFWGPGQPNGVRVQNCAGIWELVILLIIVSFLE